MAKPKSTSIVDRLTVQDAKAELILAKPYKLKDLHIFWSDGSSKLKTTLTQGENYCIVILKSDTTKYETFTIWHP
jgi:hypothetical protein